jgi:hypothetical protein
MFKALIRVALLSIALAVLTAAAASAQTVQVGPNASITFKGFISATFFGQDQNFSFGNGQNAEFPLPPEAKVDRWFYGGDVRNTRLTMTFNGPNVAGDWKVGGAIEMDFFGGNNGTGSFAGQQVVPRLRLGFVDLTNGNTTIRFGQQWGLLFGACPQGAACFVPVSVSHIAFPLGYGSAGAIGWRFPGIFLYQNLTPKGAPVNADLQVAVLANSWSAPPGTTIDSNNAGNAGSPQFEARVNVGGKSDMMSWGVYAVGHYDQKDLSGPGASAPNDKLHGTAVEVGAKFQLGGLLIQGNGYTGHSIGQNFGAITQFGKIQSEGGWAQVGYDFTKNWGLFAFAGVDDPKDSDVLKAVAASPRLKNQMYAGLLRWRSGPIALGLEWIFDVLHSGADNAKTRANQASFSALYTF